ncbi:MAG: Trk family potassium uptake protein [Clostridia bacterium]|nr:Trk family potassium uptake protein [Clostridia bacterium]
MKHIKKLSQTHLIVFSFICIILIGSALLCLPISTRSDTPIPFTDALFTATSASCVTGLIVADTYSNWTLFGQIVIICMIQIGGLGFMTIASVFSVFSKKQIGLAERNLLIQSAGTLRTSGIKALVRRVLLGTLIFEGIGAILLSICFIPQFGPVKGIYYSVFHSISAFCNAGFDLMGTNQPFSSFTSQKGDLIINFTLMALIVIGGIGFFVWNDIAQHKFAFKRYELHTKVVLVTSAVLIAGGAILFYIFENNYSLKELNTFEKIIASLFGSVSPRTAGFNTVDLDKLSDSGSMLTNALMLIGGSPGSTAGGIKTTTVAVLFLSIVSAAKKENGITVFKRSLEESAIKNAACVFFLYIATLLSAVTVIAALEPFPLKDILFEVSSAIATVGLTTGITSQLTVSSHLILAFLMFFGRIGGMTFVLMLSERKSSPLLKRPKEKILIG